MSRRFTCFTCFTLALAACSSSPSPPGDAGLDGGPCGCIAWGAAASVGLIQDAALIELSGLVASRAHPGVLYAHNDSGDSAHFFALSTTGEALGQFVLDGGINADWEDIAIGPCPSGTCVVLGDIGDNQLARTDTAIYRVSEPNVSVGAPVGTRSVAWECFRFAYPGTEKHNAEALLVHPVSGRIYVITKETAGPSTVYRFPEPLDASQTATLVKVAQLTVPRVGDSQLTAADVNPCGTAVLLRLYNRVVELRLPAGAPFEDIFAVAPIEVPSASEPQGEAIAYSADGRAYFTSSEKLLTDLPLNRVECR